VARADEGKEIHELFKKYDQVMLQKKTDLIDDVFTKKFIEASGGKRELIEKISELKTEKKAPELKVTWQKKAKGKGYFAKLLPTDKKQKSNSEFNLVEEDGKLKINGTIGDAE
jgi:hypothetical protein